MILSLKLYEKMNQFLIEILYTVYVYVTPNPSPPNPALPDLDFSKYY